MQTIEERADEWATNYPKTPNATYTNNDIEAIAKNSFIQGTTEQKAIDIDKACEWLFTHWRDYVATDRDGVIRFGGWEGDFRKAMEE